MREETWLGDFLALSEAERAAVLAELDDEALALVAEDVGLRRPVSLREHLEEVDPGPHLNWWHVGAMIEAGQAVLDGEIRFLMLHMPRRYFKSRTIAQGLSSCFIRNHPDEFVALLFASDELARRHSAYARDMVLRAGLELRRDTKSKSLWQIAGHHGGMWITTTHGFKVGQGWRLGIVDDPMTSFEAAHSAAEQRIAEDAVDSFRGSAEKGLPRPALVLMHQRFGSRDPAGRLYERERDKAKALGWTVLDFPAEKRPRRVPYPATCKVWPDQRKDGEPLCPALEGIEEIRKRQAEDPRRAAAMDRQEPMESRGGGVFPARLPIIGEGRDDLGDPVAAILNMAAQGLIAQPKRWIRGQDPAAGGADALASALLCVLEPGQGIEFVWCDMTEGHPALGLVESTVLANARRQTPESGVEQAIPKGVGEGMIFANRIQGLLRNLGYVVHVLPVQPGKVALANPHAAAATPSCRACGAIVVDRDEAGRIEGSDVCRCAVPDLVPGRVAVLAGPLAEKFVQVHADFSGDAGGDDHLVDAAACAFNAAQSSGGGWYFGTAG